MRHCKYFAGLMHELFIFASLAHLPALVLFESEERALSVFDKCMESPDGFELPSDMMLTESSRLGLS